MTWWMIVLIVAIYTFIAIGVYGALYDDYCGGLASFEDRVVVVLWPLGLIALIIVGIASVPFKLGKIIRGKIKGDKNEN